MPRLPFAIRTLNRTGAALNAVGLELPRLREADLLEEASKQTGLSDFGDDLFREGLGRLLTALEEDPADLSTLGRLMAKDSIVQDLMGRLEMVDYRKNNPEIDQEDIKPPVFIFGLPRTGTTVLYNLLAQDPRHRVPLGWEVLYPCPPPEAETYLSDPRIEKARTRYGQVDKLAPELRSIHPVGTQLPEECSTMTAREFQSRNYDYVFDVPSYYHWYVNRSQVDVYQAHRRYLQHLQFRVKRDRWLLKAPQHLPFIADLFRVYPNAELIFTHRAPTAVMPSMSSLVYQMRFLTQRSVDLARLGREQLDRWGWALDRCLAARDEMPDKAHQIADLKFNDFVKDPLAAVEGIYQRFGWPIDDDVRHRMKTFLDNNPRDKHGTHRYTLEMFDLSPDQVKERTASYADRFDLQS
jgi:hypothetical protein